MELSDGRASVSVVEVGANEAEQHLGSIRATGAVEETPFHLGVFRFSTSVSVLSSLSPSEVAYLWSPLPTRRDFCPEDEAPHEEEAPPLESRRFLKSRLRQACFEEERPRQSLSVPWVEKSSGQRCSYGVGSTPSAGQRGDCMQRLLVDGIIEVEGLNNIISRFPVRKNPCELAGNAPPKPCLLYTSPSPRD